MKMRPKYKTLGALIILLMVFGLLGCEDEIQPNNAPPAQPANPNQPKGTTKAEVEPAADDGTEYVRPEYPNSVRRNPFQPDPDVIIPTAAVAEGEVRTREPLERFALSQLTLVAIISETAVPKAMLIDGDGFGHVVKEGDRVGRNGGVISDIRDNEVEVLEGNDEEDGQTFQRIVKLRDIELRSTAEDGLTAEEREALQKLLESEAGQEALKKQLDQPQGQGQQGQQAPRQGGTQPPQQGIDPRFQGFAPPPQ